MYRYPRQKPPYLWFPSERIFFVIPEIYLGPKRVGDFTLGVYSDGNIFKSCHLTGLGRIIYRNGSSSELSKNSRQTEDI